MRNALLSTLGVFGVLVSLGASTAHASARASVTTVAAPAPPGSLAPSESPAQSEGLSPPGSLERPARPDTIIPPDELPYLQSVRICPVTACGQRSLCPSDSILVLLEGTFPTDCFSVRRIDLYVPPNASARISAPWVRVVVDDGACLGRPCLVGDFPWNGAIALPPLPEGPYELLVAIIPVSCVDTVPPPPWMMSPFPFAVTAICDTTPPPGCLIGHWHHPPDTVPCDATVTRTEPAHVTFEVFTSTALAGVQGTFLISPPGLRIARIEPVGPAAGMHLSWSATNAGVKFVMFADQGAPIPARTDEPVPILDVTAEATAGQPIPAVTEVDAVDLLGADAEGHGVSPCPIRLDDPSRALLRGARICAAPECDFNRDGLTDVRDLVLMVHCLNTDPRRETLPCAAAFDCNADSTFNLDDVLCCAWRILLHRPCVLPEGCPEDTVPPRRDDSVRVSVGLPVESADGVRVPIAIAGADRLGAARLAMGFPSDRYRVVGLEASDAAWLPLAGAQSGEIVMGVIRLGESPAGPRTLALSLHLERVPGSEGGGELGSLRGDFSGPDGAKLEVRIDAPSRPLPGGASFELSENRPDPFAGETRFTLTLPRAARVDLSVYDVNGRRVATIHRGTLPAGVSEFAWDGRLEGGGRARSGIYFYRADVDGATATRKMVRLIGE